MARPPDPDTIYARAKDEGERRLTMPLAEQASSGFIAGVTIVFGIVALGMVHDLLEPAFGAGPADLAGALAFGVGVVFLVVGRTELFTENFFDPVATAIDRSGRAPWLELGRLWGVVLVLNLVGGAVMTGIFVVPGALPSGAHEVLAGVAEHIAGKESLATFTRAIAAGALLTLLSFLLHSADSTGSRMALAWVVGAFLALGPFDHVVVSALHLLFGIWLGAAIGYADLALNIGLAAAGNLLGGILLMTLTHAVQARTARGSDG
ncbi:formate/nitrite transporter FocA (FNT family) [Blastococcus colisei]|uniref:Formate/nitrite transporter FocA (FNT family) n=1 Tax=Blastococcus colisei TaxID=1564162 RepID=A0A543PF13_9ACTN|nr:formate/nitrite transporter family protein [Blastococcus colisei]TQN42647.1 formate/nitrite transporter FocA (FNT family) [Blastococcus colisei]